MLAILRAFSMADSDGLQTTGVFGRPDASASDLAKYSMMSKIPEVGVLEGSTDPKNSASSSSSDAVLL